MNKVLCITIAGDKGIVAFANLEARVGACADTSYGGRAGFYCSANGSAGERRYFEAPAGASARLANGVDLAIGVTGRLVEDPGLASEPLKGAGGYPRLSPAWEAAINSARAL